MTRKTPVNVAASVRARLLRVSKERREDFTLTLMNYAAERFLYRLAQSTYRDRFVLKGAMLFAVRVGEQYRATRDLDLLGLGEASEAAVATAIRAIATTNVHDDGVAFDVDGLEVNLIREDNAYGGIRSVMQARLAEARIHVQIDVGFGDVITPAATDLQFPTLLADMPSPNVLAYPTETIVAEKVEAMVHLGLSNSRLKDFTDLAIAARRTAFDGATLVAAIRATFRRRGTALPETEVGGLSEQFVQDTRAQANWKAYVRRESLRDFESLAQLREELRTFLSRPIEHARTGETFRAKWMPGGPWI
jgi:predicted nucleotidyltransferase component of viral defense system